MKEFKDNTAGFSLTEVMIASAIMTLIAGAAMAIYIASQRSWHSTSLNMMATREASMSVSRIIYGTGTNCGIRAAKGIGIESAMQGTPGSGPYPPAPDDPSHYLSAGTPDGSWRLIVTNYDDSVTWFDYNAKASNIVFWPFVGTGNEIHRREIGNYISSATVTPTNDGIALTLSTVRGNGRTYSTSAVNTFVTFRNN